MIATTLAAALALVTQADEVDQTIQKLYAVISGPAGQKRDWDAFRSLFAPDARMRVAIKRQGKHALATLTPDEYVAQSGPRLEESGFFEKEIARKTLAYGGLVHVWSAYESRMKADDPKPFDRGVNSIQLVKVGDAWKIVSIAWAGESMFGALPPEHLGGNHRESR